MVFTDDDIERISQEEDGLPIKEWAGIFLDNWKWFLLSVVLCTLIALAYLRLITPTYSVNATMLVEDSQKGGATEMFGQSSAVLSDFGDIFNVKSSVDNESQILQTRNLMRKVVKDMQLYITYYDKNSIKDIELYKNNPFKLELERSPDSLTAAQLYLNDITRLGATIKETAIRSENKFDTTYTVKWGVPFKTTTGAAVLQQTDVPFKKDAQEFSVVITTVKAATAALLKMLTVSIPNKQVTTINLDLNIDLPDKGEDILNAIIKNYLQGNIEQKNAYADSAIDFINGRLVVVDKELSDIEKGVEVFKKENHIADITAQSQAVITNSADYIKDLNQTEVQEQVTNSMLNYVQDTKNNKRPVPSLLINPDPTFLVLLEKYNSLLVQRDRLVLGSTEENPLLQNLDEQIDNLRKDLVTNLQNQLAGIRIAKQKLQEQNNSINNYISSVPEKERSFLDLSRQQDIKQALFVYLLQKKEEIAVSKASNVSSARMIDDPSSSGPNSENTIAIMFGALVAGLLLPFGIVKLRHLLNNKVDDIQNLKKVTATPILGEISHSADNIDLIYAVKSRSVVSEQFRSLRTNLQFTVKEKECPVILITSSMSSEGKSFISANLGLSVASLNKRILLMELDLRKPTLATKLSVTNPIGFSNYIISSKYTLSDIVINSAVDKNIDLITSGPLPPNPAELLSDSKLPELLQKLRPHYDMIIIDAPPIGTVSDAQLIAPLADTVLYVVREGYTLKNQLHIINDLRSKNISHLYIVINDIKLKTSHKYGYGHKYRYGYGYGYTNTNKRSKGLLNPFKSKK
jgi:capsular exopolysaccharide synthesis family protein